MTINVYTTKILRMKRELDEKEFLYMNNPQTIEVSENYRIVTNNFNTVWCCTKTKRLSFRVELAYNEIIQQLSNVLKYELETVTISARVIINESELKALIRVLEEGKFTCKIQAQYPIGELLTEYDLDVSM